MAYDGLLTVAGFIDVDQFWSGKAGSKGTSDGDTVKIIVNPKTSFTFRNKSGKVIHTEAYTDAWVKSRVINNSTERKPDPVISKKNSTITIRLQGMDTPELHLPMMLKTKSNDPKKKNADFRDKNKKSGDFRQMNGGRAAEALGNYMKTFAQGGSSRVHCYFETHVDNPSDALDSHGRFVGDIVVGASAGGASINKWLVENGWAYPLFYDSMKVEEIETLIDAWKIGKEIAGRPGKGWRADLLPFGNANRVERPSYRIAGYPEKDKGPDNYPKIFRRQVKFWMRMPGALTGAQFHDFLSKATGKEQDYAVDCGAYLRWVRGNRKPGQKPKRERLVDYVSGTGRTNFQPTQLVFEEETSTLHKGPWKKEGAAKVTGWI